MTRRRVLLLLPLAWLLIAVSPSHDQIKAPPGKRPVTVADLMKVRNIQEAVISPDGKQVAYVISEVDDAAGIYRSAIWLVPAQGGKSERLTEGQTKKQGSPCWSPDSKRIAYISDISGTEQAYVVAAEGGEARRLVTPGAVKELAWAPDGKHLGALMQDPETEAAKKKKQEKRDVIVVDSEYKNQHLYTLDPDKGSVRALTKGNFHVASFDWSPNSKEIVYARQPTPRIRDNFRTNLYIIEVAPATTRTLLERNGMDSRPRWSPDGKTIAFISQSGDPDDYVGNSYIWTISPADLKPRKLTEKFDNSISAGQEDSFCWAPDGKSVYFTGDITVVRHLFQMRLDDQKVSFTSDVTQEQLHDHFSVSRDGKTAAFVIESPHMPPEVYVSDLSKWNPKRLTFTNPKVDELILGEVENVSWITKEKVIIRGLLVYPVGYKKGKQYPLLTYIHGGPALQFAKGFSLYPHGPVQGSRYPLQVLASQGYAVFCPNPRGSSGYGEQFRKANMKDWGYGDYWDIITGIDFLIGEGIADPDRLGIMGWSYGGYMTAWMVAHTDRFKAASAGTGVMNLSSMYGQTDIPAFLDRYFGGPPWLSKEVYAKHSPMTHVHQIRTPMLLQHGEKDERVPLAQSQELYQALRRTGIPVELTVYPRQGHNPSEPRLQADVMQRNVDWFNRYLKK